MAWKPKYPPDPPKRARRSWDPLIGLAVVLVIVLAALGIDRVLRHFSGEKRFGLLSGVEVGSAPSRLPVIVTKPNDANFITVRPGGSSANVVVRHGRQTDITIVDGDTVRSGGAVYRLVGFDTPERGDRASCERERNLAERAKARLHGLVTSGNPTLERADCACRAGAEGTPSCNYGRLCAHLRVSGRDVGEVLIREGLAQRSCRTAGCPPRRPWC